MITPSIQCNATGFWDLYGRLPPCFTFHPAHFHPESSTYLDLVNKLHITSLHSAKKHLTDLPYFIRSFSTWYVLFGKPSGISCDSGNFSGDRGWMLGSPGRAVGDSGCFSVIAVELSSVKLLTHVIMTRSVWVYWYIVWHIGLYCLYQSKFIIISFAASQHLHWQIK